MNPELTVIAELMERRKTDAFVVERIRYNIEGAAPLPDPKQFWMELVLALLSSQQRGTANSAVEAFRQLEPFPLALHAFAMLKNDEIDASLLHFRFHSKITRQLQENHERLFGKAQGWTEIERSLNELLLQRNTAPLPEHKVLEREVARLLDDRLVGVGPKQSRNLLQAIGLTRYEIPLDSRVVGWLRENLGWQICRDELTDYRGYEALLDRIQHLCQSAGVLPAIFDAAAFDMENTNRSSRRFTPGPGFVNFNGQVVIRNTGLPGAGNDQHIYQLGCSHCGRDYGTNGSEIPVSLCPACQGGAPGLGYTTQ